MMISMKSDEKRSSRWPLILVGFVLVFLFVIIPLIFSIIGERNTGNVALIPIEGVIMTSGGSSFGQSFVGSDEIVHYIEQANENPSIQAIVLEINSPGGSAVASDEIATAVRKANKPVITVIREAGASGGYWIASSTDYIIANKMSITGSIGVISSYLEFSGLMEKYGVEYERLVAGDRKDIGTPLRDMNNEERQILQKKLDRIHEFFIEEVARNRNMSITDVRKLATGEFYLGVEAYEYGLIDQLGDLSTAEEYLKVTYGFESVEFLVYERDPSLFDVLAGVSTEFSFTMGRGIAYQLQEQPTALLLQ